MNNVSLESGFSKSQAAKLRAMFDARVAELGKTQKLVITQAPYLPMKANGEHGFARARVSMDGQDYGWRVFGVFDAIDGQREMCWTTGTNFTKSKAIAASKRAAKKTQKTA